MNPNPEDELVPSFSSSSRKSSFWIATFNLIATIVGGGVLTLPYAFYNCGIVVATVLMGIAAFCTDFSLQLLCVSARNCGATSYGEITRCAAAAAAAASASFSGTSTPSSTALATTTTATNSNNNDKGQWAEYATSGLLFVFLLFVITGYMVLLRDIWTPIVQKFFFATSETATTTRENYVLLALLLLLIPFVVQKTLYALRWNCYVGFASVSLLCYALAHHALFDPVVVDTITHSDIDADTGVDRQPQPESIRLFVLPTRQQVLFSFPIIMLSFLCHFNIVSIQEALVQPTRRRMSNVIHVAIVLTFALMYAFGLFGYLYARSNVKGNILLNISNDWIFVLGRIGCGTTILLATPLMLLPCRESLLELVDAYVHKRQSEQAAANSGVIFGVNNRPTDPEVMQIQVGERTSLLRHDPIQQDRVFTNPYLHYGSTALIMVACYVGATATSTVATVWSLCGSSMAFLIAFILPSACFLRIESQGHDTQRPFTVAFAWILLGTAIVGAVVCTYSTVTNLET